MNTIFITSMAVLFLVPVIFIYHEVYDDGVFGRFALGGISLFSGIILLEEVFDTHWDVPAELTLLCGSAAIFMIWHLVRFHRRVVVSKRAQHGEIDRRRLLT